MNHKKQGQLHHHPVKSTQQYSSKRERWQIGRADRETGGQVVGQTSGRQRQADGHAETDLQC